MKVRASVPKKGWVWNPLKGLPRNLACPCGSGQKFKKCCLALTNDCIPEDALPAYHRTLELALVGKASW